MLTFTLSDQSLPRYSAGAKVRLFCEDQSHIPKITSVGDILILHNMKITMFRGEVFLINDKATFSCELSRLPPSVNMHHPLICYPAKYPVSSEHARLLARLREWWRENNPDKAVAVASSSPGGSQITVVPSVVKTQDRFRLVKDMEAPTATRNGRPIGNYFNMVGKVVKTFNSKNAYELYVTDYTENKNLYNYKRDPSNEGHLAKWRGPWGRYTLQITLWDINQNMAMERINEGGYVFIRNLCLKFNLAKKCYEASLHKDMQHPDRPDFVVITRMDDLRIQAIEQREREYMRRHDIEEERQAERMEREAADKRKADEEAERKELEELKEKQRAKGDNDKIQVEKFEWPVTLIGDILGMNLGDRFYVNLKYHIVSRVIEFKPDNIEDFAKYEVPEGFSQKRWRWRFALLVEGRDSNVMRLIVMDEDAEYLLKMPATEYTCPHLAGSW